MSFLAPLVAPALKFGGSLLASKLLGGGQKQPKPSGFSGGGATGSFSGNSFNVNSSPERLGLVNSLASLFPQQANLVAGLRSQVTPGVGALTQSRLAELGNRANVSIGNLKENLARRKVLGSSFGADAVSRAESEFAQQADRIRAESFLQELDLQNKLLQQEFQLRRQEIQTSLDDMNFNAGLASKHGGAIAEQLLKNASVREELNAKAATGAGDLFGKTFGTAIDKMNFGNLFGGGTPSWTTQTWAPGAFTGF